MQGVTVVVALVIAVAAFVSGGSYGWIVSIIGLVIAAVAVLAIVKGWSLFGRPGPF